MILIFYLHVNEFLYELNQYLHGLFFQKLCKSYPLETEGVLVIISTIGSKIKRHVGCTRLKLSQSVVS
jgi:hypothetical protein